MNNDIEIAKELVKISKKNIASDNIGFKKYKQEIKTKLEKLRDDAQAIYAFLLLNNNSVFNKKLQVFDEVLNVKLSIEEIIEKIK